MGRRGTGRAGGYLLAAALALASLGAAPTRTPTPSPVAASPTPTSPPKTPTQTPIATPTLALTPTPRPIVMPDLPVASVRSLPVGSAPLAVHAWTPSADLQAAIDAAVARHQGTISVV